MTPEFTIRRDKNGIPHIKSDSLAGVFSGQGFAHATDRGMQILLMRILGQGRGAELLDDSDRMVAIDTFFRRMNWADTQGYATGLTPETKEYLAAYTAGVNAAFAESYPWEFKLLGVEFEEWTAEHTVLLARMTGYLTLVQSQAEMERFIVEIIKEGTPEHYLEELFPGLLGGLDVELLRQVSLGERIVQSSDLWKLAIPRTMASNNWVVAGTKTKSGRPVLSNDPHLEVNRLPNVWCEQVLSDGDRFMMGGTMPGLPGVLTGRNPDLAWGVTYAFIDSVDSWVEKCDDGRYFRQGKKKWHEFKVRREIIKRKKRSDIEVKFYENEHGTLDGDPNVSGLYLATKWAAADAGAKSLNALGKMWQAATVKEGMKILSGVETGWNFVFSDTKGNIGYQMSGLVPKRRQGISGLIPLAGWEKKNNWTGMHKASDMPKSYNPTNGFFTTANNDLNEYGKISPINLPMGAYRADRIAELLDSGKDLTVNNMFAMHYDVYSKQAELFMVHLKPLLLDTKNGRILKEWDLKYDADSKGAYLFEAFYKSLYREVFGKLAWGEKLVDFLDKETSVFIDFYDNFDRILLSAESVWFKGRSREQLYEDVARKLESVKAKPWKTNQSFSLTNILFDGKLPRFLGFDRGPVVAIGNRATIHQGQIYRAGGRATSFLPSFRYALDMADNTMYTNLAGGPSDRRFSRWYASDLVNWVTGRYKKLDPADPNATGNF